MGYRHRANLAALLVLATSSLLSACSGGGSSPSASSGNPPAAAPTGLSYPSPSVFAMGRPIAPLSPSVTGSVTAYSIAPALPGGLGLNTGSGVISGVPTAASLAATYTVTASNSSGQTTATLSIAINESPPVLTRSSAQLTLTTGVPVHINPAINTGGVALNWAISPALPAGLSFDTANGSIQGTPSAVTPSADYLISAQNSGGRAELTVSIAVESGVLMELGHGQRIDVIRVDGNRALSRDFAHWALWNVATAELVASGDAPCPTQSCDSDSIALFGGTFVIRTGGGFELRAASDGHLKGNVTAGAASWKLSAAGTYLAATGTNALSVWSDDGTLLFARAGDYSAASIFAAANEIRIGAGPAGASIIETVSVPAATSSLSSTFNGQFHSWFVDGNRFITRVANTIWIYSKSVVQEDLKSMPTIQELSGQGTWFWTHEDSPNRLTIYEVGASTTPRATYDDLETLARTVASGMTIGILPYGEKSLSIVDLAAASPSRVDYTTSVAYGTAYAAASDLHWWIGTTNGVLLERTVSDEERVFAPGRAFSIAGSRDRVVVATASGKIYSFDSDHRTLEGTIDFASSQVVLSNDGSVLAAAGNREDAQYHTDRTVKILALPAQTEINSWPYTYPTEPLPWDISLSGSGTTLGQVLGVFSSRWNYTPEVSTVLGSPIWSDSTGDELQPIRLSPDGTLIALSSGPSLHGTGTDIFDNGTLVTAVPAWAVGWIDDARLLVNNYTVVNFRVTFDGASIYDASGDKLVDSPLPELRAIQTVTSDSVYSPERNSILSLSSGAALWTSPNPTTGVGAVAGSRVVFASGAQVRSEPY